MYLQRCKNGNGREAGRKRERGGGEREEVYLP
jgi:hypothetical protein